MKKNLTICILAVTGMIFSSVAMAGKIPMFTISPTPFYANLDDNKVVFTWSDPGFYKYSVDINNPKDVYTAHYSFSIDPSVCTLVDAAYNCSLTVPFSAFVWDTNTNPVTNLVPFYNTASVKIITLDPSDNRDFNQQNAFSDSDTFVLVTRAPLQDKNTFERLVATREF